MGSITEEKDSQSPPPMSGRRRSSTKTMLIEKDGKTVSRTSQGKRKFHNKSKLGCDSCKRRRVKCDETKPICNKCSNMGLQCVYSVIAVETSPVAFTEAAVPEKKGPKIVKEEERGIPQQPQQQQQLPQLAGIEQELARLTGGSASMDDISKLINAARANGIMIPPVDQLHQFQQQLPFPTITIKSPPMEPAAMQSFARSQQLDRAGLSIDLGMENNPTISPQPTMSPVSTHSPISLHHHHPPPMADFHTQMASMTANSMDYTPAAALNLIDLKLMYHYTATVAPTITTAGISEKKIWMEDIPQLAFEFAFLMHAILAFSATHLSRSEKNMERYVTYHRGEALRLLREAVLEISADNTDATDALVASALILIMDSLANASLPSASSATSLPASAWIFHVKGAATILTAVWPLPQTSRFYTFISVDLSDLGDIINGKDGNISDLVCFDESISDLYPVEYDSPYLITLAYLDKLHKEKYQSDFILRVFAFPALLDKTFLALLMSGDLSAMRIMRSYYTLLRGFTTEMKDRVWFLEGVSNVLPADVDDYTGGGGMHMMLDFLGGGLPSMASSNLASGLNVDINDHFMNP